MINQEAGFLDVGKGGTLDLIGNAFNLIARLVPFFAQQQAQGLLVDPAIEFAELQPPMFDLHPMR